MKKTISFASVHMTVAFSVGYVMTGDVVVGGTMALVEPACNTVAYYFHEKVWSRRGAAAEVTEAPTSVIPA
ncbi:DUF2061 domain-containing protein [Pseudomaricurvus sp. HS19]|uniref:DUF2061 domain-containing protein n=1 Tax=Pseudomaricurvus sp. HS19 TaxID=2692626 RepID=UPI00136D44DB|nr:DUF2061 domain-containing protein [Pseudomaricurvus sp. HS19]MYM64435.1 DUF2061 domain-containing protein [Pseudomaricurvus sp. HS19]